MNFFTLQTTSFVDQITIEGTVEALNSSTVVCPNRIDGIVLFIIEDGIQVNEGDTVCIVENREIINYYESLVNKVEQSIAQYSKGKADLDMAYALLMAQVESNEAQTAIANLDSLQLQYLPEYQRKIKSLQLEITHVEKQKYQKKLEFLEQINQSELRRLELQIKQDQNQANDIKETLDGMVMLAPRSGMVLRSQLPHTRERIKEGDEIWEGIKVVDIPDMSKVNVKIMATEPQYKRIAENNDVVFMFDAMPGNRAWGKIVKKATMGQPISRNSKIRHFEITASIDSFIALPEIGVSAQCNIISTNIPDTIVVPQLAIFDEDSSKVVYVKMSRNSFEKRQVVLGNYSPRSAIIAVGLQGNETVSFVKPKVSKVISTINLPDSILQKYRQAFRNSEMNNIPSDFDLQSDDDNEVNSFVIYF